MRGRPHGPSRASSGRAIPASHSWSPPERNGVHARRTPEAVYAGMRRIAREAATFTRWARGHPGGAPDRLTCSDVLGQVRAFPLQ